MEQKSIVNFAYFVNLSHINVMLKTPLTVMVGGVCGSWVVSLRLPEGPPVRHPLAEEQEADRDKQEPHGVVGAEEHSHSLGHLVQVVDPQEDRDDEGDVDKRLARLVERTSEIFFHDTSP